ncbi:MAG: LLM class flavin-dependent oxidoreductase [Candidatus Binatia bacterium]
MHLVGFMLHCPMNHTILSWTHPLDKVGYSWTEPEFWQEIARTLERGRFDCLFLADQLAAFDVYRGSMDATLRYATQFPIHDALLVVPAMSVVTERLGFAVTATTTYDAPYLLARKLSTLDHLTKGRIGWNVVTSVHNNEARNCGLPAMLPHQERYDRAQEFMEVCYKLWNSWEPGAVVMDKERGIFADPAKVHRINHTGKYFDVPGPHCCAPSPQGRPVIIQAGASEQGRDFAAQHAEYVFGIQLRPDAMRAFSEDVRQRAVKKYGRKPEDFKIIFGIQVILGQTEDEAKAKQEVLNERVTLDAALAILSGHMGFDFSQLDPDQPLEHLKVEGVQGILDALTIMLGKKKLTLREAALMHGRSVSMPQVVGTPEQVADQMEYLMREGGGDGFQITPTYAPGSFQEMVDGLVPVLQKRGLHRKEYTGKTLREHLQEY